MRNLATICCRRFSLSQFTKAATDSVANTAGLNGNKGAEMVKKKQPKEEKKTRPVAIPTKNETPSSTIGMQSYDEHFSLFDESPLKTDDPRRLVLHDMAQTLALNPSYTLEEKKRAMDMACRFLLKNERLDTQTPAAQDQ